MKNKKLSSLFIGFYFTIFSLLTPLHAMDLAKDFSFDGYLLDTSDNPITTTVAIKFQIYNPSGTCMLFEENHASVTPDATGYFQVKVGSGTRGSDGGLAWKQIFQNDTVIPGSLNSNCVSGYTPAIYNGRNLRVTVGATVLSPDYVMSPVPMATVAESLQGKTVSDFVTIPASTTFNLPNTNGTVNYFLQTDGAGTTTWATPSASGITSLGAQTGSTQTFAFGTSGLTPAWSSASDVHTFSIPMASTASVTAGLISKADYDAFNAKLSSTLTNGNFYIGNGSNVATGVAPSGDVSLTNAGVFTVTKIQTKPVDATVPNYLGQILAWDGAQWKVSNPVSATDGALMTWDNTNSRWKATTAVSINGTGNLALTNAPSASTEAANKNYVDGMITSAVDIAGDTMTGALILPAGTAIAPSLRVGASTTGLFSSLANNMGFVTNGTERIRVDASGNVGVGTNTPAAMLDVNGPVKVGVSGTPMQKIVNEYTSACGGAFASIAAGSTAVCIVTGLTGITSNAITPHSVQCSPAATISNFATFSCFIDAVNSVKISVYNSNASPITLTPNWHITYIQF